MLYIPENDNLSPRVRKKRKAAALSYIINFKISFLVVVGLFLFGIQYYFVETINIKHEEINVATKDSDILHDISTRVHDSSDRDNKNAEYELEKIISDTKLKRLQEKNQDLEKKLELELEKSKHIPEHINNTYIDEPQIWKKIRIYCMIPTLFESYRMKKINAAVATWGQYCDVIKLFVDGNSNTLKYYEINQSVLTSTEHIKKPKIELIPINIVRKNDIMDQDRNYRKKSCTHFDEPIACRHIWEKVWRSWVYIAENDIDSADYFFKIDDDSFIFVNNIKRHIFKKGWSPDEDHYFGHVSYIAPKPYVNGAMVGVSRNALRRVSELYKKMPNEYGPRSNFEPHKCVDRDGASQEVTESICFHKLGIKAKPFLDEYKLQTVALFGFADSLALRKRKNTKSWYWKDKPKHHICCSDYPSAVHWYKNPNDILRVFDILLSTENTELDKLMFNRTLMDEYRSKPLQKVKSLISVDKKITLLDFMLELMYLWKVKQNLVNENEI